MPCDQIRLVGVKLDDVTTEEFKTAIQAAGGTTSTYNGRIQWRLGNTYGEFTNGTLNVAAYQGNKALVEAGASAVRGAIAAYHVQSAAERFGWIAEQQGNEITLSRRAF